MVRDNSESQGGLEVGVVRQLINSLYEDDAEHHGEAGLMRVGNYLLDQQLGVGGGGVVYQGVKLGTQHRVTVKLLSRPLGEGEAARRAWHELDVLEQLRCPAVPRLQEHGIHEGRLFLAYDHIDGLPLDKYCDTNSLDLRARVRLLVKTARALQSVHERGFIHRDIKPANILVDSERRPYVIDLGLASLVETDPESSLSGEGLAIGTLGFMAPEQARGDRADSSTRSDVYGLAATACCVLTGETPHDIDADLPEAIRRVGQDPPRDVRDLDPNLPAPIAAVLNKALSPRSEDRFASVTDFADDLQRWLDDRPVLSQPPSWWRNRRLAIRRHPVRWAWGATTTLVIAGLAIFGVVGHVQAFQALEKQVKAEYTIEQLELRQVQMEITLAEEEAKLARILHLSAEWSATLATVFRDEDYARALAMLTLLTAAIELEFFDAGRLFDADQVRGVLKQRGMTVDGVELNAMLAQLETTENAISLLLHRLLGSLYPHELHTPDRIMAWLLAVLDIDGVWDDQVVAEIETRLWQLYETTPE